MLTQSGVDVAIGLTDVSSLAATTRKSLDFLLGSCDRNREGVIFFDIGRVCEIRACGGFYAVV